MPRTLLRLATAAALFCLGCQPSEPEVSAASDESELSWKFCKNLTTPQADGTYAKLSDTGLYCNIKLRWITPGVRFYEPEYTLWSDGADKMRWLQLPPGEKIDTSDMDNWKFPVGTKVWKEFSLAGKRQETRFLEKRADGTWLMVAFAWNEAQTDAFPAPPEGVQNTLGTTHDIPTQAQCTSCHRNASDTLLSVAAMQLQRANPWGETLFKLAIFGQLSDVPTKWYRFPGDRTESAALGYLYANCSGCHRGATPPAGVNFFTSVNDETPEQTQSFLTTVGQPLTRWTGHGYEQRIVAGHPEQSAVIARMATRVPADQMPKIGTEVVHEAGVASVSAWIAAMPQTSTAP